MRNWENNCFGEKLSDMLIVTNLGLILGNWEKVYTFLGGYSYTAQIKICIGWSFVQIPDIRWEIGGTVILKENAVGE